MTQDQVITTKIQAITSHANRGVGPQVNAIASTRASRVWYFMRMNPSTFHRNKVDKYPHVLIDEVFKVVDAMEVTSREKVELAAYQLKNVTQVWFEQWRDAKHIRADPIYWKVFKTIFLNTFFRLGLRDTMLVEFINLRQGEWVYMNTLPSSPISKYAPTFVANSRYRMNKFVTGVSTLVEEKSDT